jgi:hypothetical protein
MYGIISTYSRGSVVWDPLGHYRSLGFRLIRPSQRDISTITAETISDLVKPRCCEGLHRRRERLLAEPPLEMAVG